MDAKKIGNYAGKPVSLILLEESLGRNKSLFQYHCKCGDKFSTLIYALIHCEKKHVGQTVEEQISYKMILRRDLMQSLYEAASVNIAKESDSQLQKRLEAESLKHQQELRELETRLRAEFETEKEDASKWQRMQEFSMNKVKAEPMSPTRDSESYSDHASIGSGIPTDFGFSDIKAIDYQPKTKMANGSPIPVLGQKSAFNPQNYYDTFEQDVDDGFTTYSKLGKRPRHSMDSGCGSPSWDPAEKRALMEEETKDPETGTSSYNKIVIPITMNKLALKLPKKPVIYRENGCQTESELKDKEPRKIMVSSGAQSSPTVVSAGIQCNREKSLFDFLGLKSSQATIPMKVLSNSCIPRDPRKERRDAELSVYYRNCILPNNIPFLPCLKPLNLKQPESHLVQKSEEELTPKGSETITDPNRRLEALAKNICDNNNSSSSSICTATRSTPMSPSDEHPARFLVSHRPRTPIDEPLRRRSGPRTPSPQPVPPPPSFDPYNEPATNCWPCMPVFFPSIPPPILSRPPPLPNLRYWQPVPAPLAPPEFVPPPPPKPPLVVTSPTKRDDTREVAMDIEESAEEPENQEKVNQEPLEQLEEEDIKPIIPPVTTSNVNPASDAIFLLKQFIDKFKKS